MIVLGRKPILPDEFGNYTEKQLEKLRSRARNSAVWYLSRQPYTRFQLQQKLERKLIPDDIINSTLSKLEETGWVNDAAYAEQFIYSKRKYEKLGVSAIRQKLILKGISRDIIDEQLAEISMEEQADTAYQLAERKHQLLSRKETDPQKLTQKLVQYLAYRGYPASVAYSTAKQIIQDNPPPPPQE